MIGEGGGEVELQNDTLMSTYEPVYSGRFISSSGLQNYAASQRDLFHLVHCLCIRL